MDSMVVEEERKIPFLKILNRNLLFILIITVICGLAGTVLGIVRAKPVYTAKCNLILNVDLTGSDEAVNNNNTIAKNFLPTIVMHLRNSAEVFDNANANYTDQKGGKILYGNFSAKYTEGSTIFTLKYSDSSEALARNKLSAIISSAKTYISSESGKNLVQADSVSIEETQSDYSVEVSDKYVFYVLAGVLAGIIISVVVALLRFILDNKMKTSSELEKITGVSVLAYIESNR